MTICFTVDSPLGDNFSGLVTPTSFTAHDGVYTGPNTPSIDIADAWNYCTLPNCGEETYAGQGYTPGVWSANAVGATPIPAALPFFATGLGGLGFLGWRKTRKAAAAIAA